MNEYEQTRSGGGVDLSDERARAVDEVGRRAGAALRSTAPAHGADSIEGLVHRRKVVRAAAATVVVGLLVLAGMIAWNTDDRPGRQQPVDSIPNSGPLPALEAVEIGNLEGGPARFTADGSLVVGRDQQVDLYDAALTKVGAVPCPTRLETLPDPLGTAASDDWVWDVGAASQWSAGALATLNTSIWPDLCGVMVNADGSRALTMADIKGDGPPDGGERRLLLWDTSDGSLVSVIAGVSPGFGADGSTLLTADSSSLTLRSSRTGEIVKSVSFDPGDHGFGSAAVSRDGTRVLTWGITPEGDLAGAAVVHDLATLTPIATLATAGRPDAISQNEAQFDSAGRVFTLDAAGVTVWDAETGQQLRQIPVQLALNNNILAITPDGELISVSHGDRITIFDSSSGERLADIALGPDEFGGSMFSPDGRTLAASLAGLRGGEDSQVIRVWRLDPIDEPSTTPRASDRAILEEGVAAYYSGDGDRAAELFELADRTDDQLRADSAYQKAIGGHVDLNCTEGAPGSFSCVTPYHNAMTEAVGDEGGRDVWQVTVKAGVITQFGFTEHTGLLIDMATFLASEDRFDGFEDCIYGPFEPGCAAIENENLDGWAAWHQSVQTADRVAVALASWYRGDCAAGVALSFDAGDCAPSSVPAQTTEYESILDAEVSVDNCSNTSTSGDHTRLSCDVSYSNVMSRAVGAAPAVTAREFAIMFDLLLAGADEAPWYEADYPENTDLRESFTAFAATSDFADAYAAAGCATTRSPECATLIIDHLDAWATWHRARG